MAARSTTNGTPVKSCNTIRATTKGISSFAGFFAFQLASVSKSRRRTFCPSQLRRTDSRTMRMLIGNREIFPTPCFSKAGKECKNALRPLPASNEVSVLNSSFISLCKSFQLGQLGFDFVEVRECTGVVITLSILNHALAIDDENGSLRHTAHPEIHLRQKRIISHTISLSDPMFVVAQ